MTTHEQMTKHMVFVHDLYPEATCIAFSPMPDCFIIEKPIDWDIFDKTGHKIYPRVIGSGINRERAWEDAAINLKLKS